MNRNRRQYRIDLSASKFADLSEDLDAHKERDRGRRLAELAALGLMLEKEGVISTSGIKALGLVSGKAPSPTLPSPPRVMFAEGGGAKVVRPEEGVAQAGTDRREKQEGTRSEEGGQPSAHIEGLMEIAANMAFDVL